jgi:hypothetical protein
MKNKSTYYMLLSVTVLTSFYTEGTHKLPIWIEYKT